MGDVMSGWLISYQGNRQRSTLLFTPLVMIFVVVIVFGHIASMWDSNSPARDSTWAPRIEVQSPNHWTTGEVPALPL